MKLQEEQENLKQTYMSIIENNNKVIEFLKEQNNELEKIIKIPKVQKMKEIINLMENGNKTTQDNKIPSNILDKIKETFKTNPMSQIDKQKYINGIKANGLKPEFDPEYIKYIKIDEDFKDGELPDVTPDVVDSPDSPDLSVVNVLEFDPKFRENDLKLKEMWDNNEPSIENNNGGLDHLAQA